MKAYSRLGLSNFFLERYEDAVSAYQRAVELEPDNKASQDSLRQAQNKLRKVSLPNPNPPNSLPNMMDSLPELMSGGHPSMKNAMDKIGGSAGLASLMQDPAMMQMAQQMMKDPNMMQQALAMMQGGGGGGPDLGALAGLMGGGGGGGGGGAPSSSSGKKPFKGFEE